MMTRGSKQLSSTLQEFRVPRLASRAGRNTSTIPDEGDTTTGANTSGSVGFQQTSHLLHSPPKETPLPQGASQEYRSPTVAAPETNANFIGATGGGGVGIGRSNERQANHLLQPLVMQFSIVLQRLSVTAALLPSLQAQYQMEQVVSAGITGGKQLYNNTICLVSNLEIKNNKYCCDHFQVKPSLTSIYLGIRSASQQNYKLPKIFLLLLPSNFLKFT